MTPTPTPTEHRATTHFGLRWNVVQRFLLATLLPLTIVWYVDPTAPTMADARLYDRVLATFPSAAESNVVIVAIDNESIQKIGPWPWPEAVHTKFLQQLDLQSPKAVVLNFMLGAPAHSGDDDAALVAALRVLPVYLSVRNDPSAAFAEEIASGLVQTRRFAPAVQGSGHSTLASEGASEQVRFVRLFAGGPNALLPYLGALVDPSSAMRRAVEKGKLLRLGIPFARSAVHRTVSFDQVLQGELRVDELKGRTILVGPSLDSTLSMPVYVAGPHGATLVSSTDVHASAIDALQQGTEVSVATPFAIYACIAFLIWATLFMFDRISKIAPLVGMAMIVFAVACTVVALRCFQIWIPSSFFVVGVLAAYVLWTWQYLHKVLSFMKARILSLSHVPAGTFDPAAPLALRGADTTDRYIGALDHAIARLLRLQKLTRLGLEQIPIAILMCRANGTIAQLNAAAVGLLPPMLDDVPSLLNQNFPSVVARLETRPSLRRPEADEHWSQALDGEYNTPQGRVFRIEATRLGNVLDSAPTAWIVVLRELTQVRKAERERADWLSFLWHDLRSPQINLLSLLELFEMTPSRVGVAQLVAGVRHEAERTMTLAQNFINSSTSEARDYRFAVASLSSLLANSIEALASSATARNVRVLLRPAPVHHDLIRADGGMLTRALVNLLENAIRHSRRGTTIRVCCSAEESLEAVVIIQDEGMGMAPAELDALLEGAPEDGDVAVDAPPRDRNHGFGFPMVRQVVAAHDGWISGWSMAGVGTTFAIGFPLIHA